MRFYNFRAQIFLILAICGGASCVSPSAKKYKTYEFYRRDMGLLSCGQQGSIGLRMSDCQTKNPVFSTSRVKGSPHQWSLVSYDAIGELELWFDHSAGKVWSNAFRYKSINCIEMNSIEDGGREYRFRGAKHQEYRDAFEHEMPMRSGKTESRLFVPADVEERGMVVDEFDHTLKNVEWEKPLWMRCIAG